MSQTETKVTTVNEPKFATELNIMDLKTIQWIKNVGLVKQTYVFTIEKSNATVRRIPLLNWILASIEMVFISLLLFINNLPWPNWMLNIIFKIDHIIEHILESIFDTIEWWWDNIVVRLMWLRDSLEAFVDTLLSLCLFLMYRAFELFIWALSCTLQYIKFIFSPFLWVIKAIMPPAGKKSTIAAIPIDAAPSSPAPANAMGLERCLKDVEPMGLKRCLKDVEPEEIAHLSGTTSDCESDVSVMSESWSIGHTDKFGTSYSRVQMKATAEGRLRAAMYRRVKGQLGLMRKNSINFSRGMTSYARLVLEPKVIPVVSAMKDWLIKTAATLGLLELLGWFEKWVHNHYLPSILFTFLISASKVPINILNKTVWNSKKKSRRTRSMRSESLRRRTYPASTVTTPPVLESFGLIKSKEPVLMEEVEFCSLRKIRKKSLKDEEGLMMRDSALASSIDDLCHTSDSNDGAIYSKNRIIHEEEENEKEIANENKISRLNLLEPFIGIEKPEGEMESSTSSDKKNSTTKASKLYLSTTKAKQENDKMGAMIKKENKLNCPSNKWSNNVQEETNAQLAKPEDSSVSVEQNSKSCKSPKRKISFSLDS